MRIKDVLKNVECGVHGSLDTETRSITYDSRKVRKHSVFVAVKGENFDGNEFIDKALESGASCIVSEKFKRINGAVFVVVKDVIDALSLMSANFYHNPDKEMLLFGITGTNGKTTTSYLIESIFNEHKIATGVIGTINYRYNGINFPAENTTPQSSDIFEILSNMLISKVNTAVLEVSSHALDLGRVKNLEFDSCIFTNLTQDHLDFHKTMDRYFHAKSKLFTEGISGNKKYPKFAIINVDDEWGRKLAGLLKKVTVITYGFSDKASIRAENINATSKFTEFTLITPIGKKRVRLSFIGKHNIYNALAASACALSNGITLEGIAKAFEDASMVPGRLELVEEGQPYTVVVDYAHTDDALKNVICALKELNPSRLITVFGCGGDRDRSKRPKMGEVAADLSDFVFVTSDNPRTEDPEKIILDIEVGIRRKQKDNYKVVVDREQAIAQAVAMSQKNDILLIAGKGHETYQIIGRERFHFSDQEISKKYIVSRLINGKC